MNLPSLTLVLGGAASGKSAFSENLLRSSGLSRVYLATAQAWDDEMRARISRHRDQRGSDWQTIEAPRDLCGPLGNRRPGEAVLIDCLTLWLSNTMLADDDTGAAMAALLAALSDCPAPVVAVSNEVGQGIVPDNALARRFRDAQGALNRRVAERAGLVVAVMAGLPLVLKGRLP